MWRCAITAHHDTTRVHIDVLPTDAPPAAVPAAGSATPPAEHGAVNTRLGRLTDFVARNSLLVVLIAILAGVLCAVAPQLLVADSWMTLVAGREIVAHGLPSTEALTVIPAGRPWTDQQWLAQLLFYGSERLGGLRLALLLDVLIVVSAFAFAVAASRARGASAKNTLFAASAAMLMAPWGWQLRAQSFALPLFVGVLWLMSLDPMLRRRRTWLVFPLLVLWANLHGSVILGAAIVSTAGAIALAHAVLRRPHPGAGRIAALLALPWACVLASPYALDLPGYYKLLLVDSPVSKVINEWQAPTPSGWMLFFFGVAAATVVLVAWQWRRLSLFDVAVLALTLVGSLRSTRGIVWFALAVAVLLPLAMDGAFGGDRNPLRRRLGIALGGDVHRARARVRSSRPQLVPRAGSGRTGRTRRHAQVAAATRDAGTMAVYPSDKHADWLLWRLPELQGPRRLRRALRARHGQAAGDDRALQVARAGMGCRHTRVQRGGRRPAGHAKARCGADERWGPPPLSRTTRSSCCGSPAPADASGATSPQSRATAGLARELVLRPVAASKPRTHSLRSLVRGPTRALDPSRRTHQRMSHEIDRHARPHSRVRALSDERGQGLVEYGLIIGVVSVAAVVALGFLSGNINSLFGKSGNKLNGISVSAGSGSGGSGGDTTPPFPTAVSTGPDNNNGRVESGDNINVTFSEPIDLGTICGGWDGTQFGGADIRLNDDGWNDFITVTASGGHCSGNQVNFGELRLGENYIVGDSRTWETSVVSWNASTNTLTIRPAGGNELGTLILVPSSTLAYTPSAGVTDVAGNAVTGSISSANAQWF